MDTQQASKLESGQRLKASVKISTIDAGEHVYFISHINSPEFPLFSYVENSLHVKYTVDLSYFELAPLSRWERFIEAVKTFFS